MKILVADKMEPWGLDQLKGLADEVHFDPALKDDALRQCFSEFNPNIVIVRSTKINADAMQAGADLRMIIRAGSGYDTIDVAAASERGIRVCNCPGMNAVAVAELTIGLMVSMDRCIPDNVQALREHKWKKKQYSKAGRGLKGRTLGIVGAGRIGAEVGNRALAFDMNVLYYHIGRQKRLYDHPHSTRAELEELLRQSDIVTIHVPGGSSTKHLIDAEHIALMKEGAMFINTSRADVVDEHALIAALKEGKLRAAALDVFENEPTADAETFDSPVCDVPNLYGTHHIGASTEQAQLAVATETVRIVQHFKETGEAINCVNNEQTFVHPVLILTFDHKPGALPKVFEALDNDSIMVTEFDQVTYDHDRTASAHLRLNKQPSPKLVDALKKIHPTVKGVELIAVD